VEDASLSLAATLQYDWHNQREDQRKKNGNGFSKILVADDIDVLRRQAAMKVESNP